jgi:hypothetical protein
MHARKPTLLTNANTAGHVMSDHVELAAAAALLTAAAAILETSERLAFAAVAVAFVLVGVWIERT